METEITNQEFEPRFLEGHSDYEIYSDGRVYSHKSDHWLSQYKNPKTGYYTVVIDRKQFYVHRLVALCYVAVPSELEGRNVEVDHIDNVKSNNSYQNLRWVEHSTNIARRQVQNNYWRERIPSGASHWHSRKIRVTYLDDTTKDYDSARECADDNDISYPNLRKILCGAMKQYCESDRLAGKDRIRTVEYIDGKTTRHCSEETKAKISKRNNK